MNVRRVIAALVVALTGAGAGAAELITLAGQKSAGTFEAITPEGVRFRDAAGAATTTPATEVAAVVFRPAAAPPKDLKYDELELVDGSRFRASQVAIAGKVVTLTAVAVPPLAAPTITMPLSALSWWQRGAHDPAARDAWQKLLATRGPRDLFVVKESTGLNPLRGTVLEGVPAGNAVQFELEDGTRSNLRLTRATGGIVFQPLKQDVVPPTACKVVDSLGNVWQAKALAVAGGGLTVDTVAGATVTYANLDAVERLDFRQGNVAYLSDLPEAAEYAPVEGDGPLGGQFGYRVPLTKDKAADGGELRLDGLAFKKGVAVPADAVVKYKLDGNYREFKAMVGLPEGAAKAGWSLKYRVELDGRPVVEETVAPGAKPKAVTLNVKDAKSLTLAVERVGLFQGDALHFADARVQK